MFGKEIINDIDVINPNVMYSLKQKNIKEKLLETKQNNEIVAAEIQQDIQKFFRSSLSIKNFSFDNAKINIILDDIDNEINILKFQLSLNLKGDNLKVSQNAIFNINNDKTNSKIDIDCNTQNKIKTCKASVENISPNSLKTFFKKQSGSYNYFSNTNGYFNGEFNLIFDKQKKLQKGSGIIKSKIGSFDFKNLFDEKLLFGNLVLNVSFDNYLKDINIDSLTTNFGKTNFFMSMFIQEKDEYKNIDLNFDIKSTPVSDLRKLWPNFLGNDTSRPWVLEHIKSGNIPEATANMNFKYFKNDKNNSGLQSIKAELNLNNLLLNYNKYFPVVKNIYGKDIFNENSLKVKIKSHKIKNSK